jgi:uncharacterized protein
MSNAAFGDPRYIALTTYRRDGRPVTTPVWLAALDGKIYVFTANTIGKAKRVRASGRVRFGPLQHERPSHPGRMVGGHRTCRSRRALRCRAMAALQRKYGWQLSVAMLAYRLRGLHRHQVVLELTPAPRT